MDALPHLGAIVHFGVGYDTTDVERAAQLGIGVSNTPDVLNASVADTAVALVLDTMRGFSAAYRFVRAGRWPVEGNVPLSREVSDARVGILGLGGSVRKSPSASTHSTAISLTTIAAR